MATATANNMASADDLAPWRNKKWMYVDAHGGQKGPLDECVLKRLLRRGLLQGENYVWSPDLVELMPNWQMAKDTPVFAAACVLWQPVPQWYYFDHLKQQKGPITTSELTNLFMEGDIDGLTMVWSSYKVVDEWTAMGQVHALKEVLQEINDENEKKEQLRLTEKSLDPKTFVLDKDGDSDGKAFVAENGSAFIYDEESRKWITPEEKIQDELELMEQELLDAKVNVSRRGGGGDPDDGDHGAENEKHRLKLVDEKHPKAKDNNLHPQTTSASLKSSPTKKTTLTRKSERRRKNQNKKQNGKHPSKRRGFM